MTKFCHLEIGACFRYVGGVIHYIKTGENTQNTYDTVVRHPRAQVVEIKKVTKTFGDLPIPSYFRYPDSENTYIKIGETTQQEVYRNSGQVQRARHPDTLIIRVGK